MICYSLLYSWVWAEGGQNPDLESNLDVGGFGYPVGETSLLLATCRIIQRIETHSNSIVCELCSKPFRFYDALSMFLNCSTHGECLVA